MIRFVSISKRDESTMNAGGNGIGADENNEDTLTFDENVSRRDRFVLLVGTSFEPLLKYAKLYPYNGIGWNISSSRVLQTIEIHFGEQDIEVMQLPRIHDKVNIVGGKWSKCGFRKKKATFQNRAIGRSGYPWSKYGIYYLARIGIVAGKMMNQIAACRGRLRAAFWLGGYSYTHSLVRRRVDMVWQNTIAR